MAPAINPQSYNTFQYQALPDSATHIRLLRVFRIKKSSSEPNVRCQLTIWPEDSAPSYYAISYTWGDPLLTTEILVNGRRMRVRQNCEYALKQVFWQGGSRYHWVDALCINQDDFEEKAEQVARMATIFSKALRVLACVGKHADGSKSFFRFVRKHAESFSTAAQSHTNQDYIGEGLTWWFILCRPWRIPGQLRRLQVFLQRSYFKRLWEFQELFHARAVTYCCGGTYVPAEALEGLSIALWNMKTYKDRLPGLRHRFLHESYRGLYTLGGVLGHVRGFECQDPRDKIYAILSMVDWKGEAPIHPDYTRSVLSLALEVIDRVADISTDSGIQWATELLGTMGLEITTPGVPKLLQA